MDYSLTKEEIKLIQFSFNELTALSKTVGETFYKKLFDANPEMIKLFKGDIKEQAGALMRMVKTVVEGLNNPDIIIPAVQNLGRRHDDYGVTPEQYKIFGDCLVACIEQELGNDFNTKTRKAWEKLYSNMTEIMNRKV